MASSLVTATASQPIARTTSATWLKAAEHRNPVHDGPGQLRGRQADADHFHARVRLALNPLAELLRRTEAADHDDVAETASAALQKMEALPGKEAN